MLNEALIVLLIMGWAAVLLPSALRSRSRSVHVSVGGFEHAMAVLRRGPDGREIMVPHDSRRIVGERESAGGQPVRLGGAQDPLIARRRSLFLRLAATTGTTFVLAVVFGGMLWPLFFVTAMVLGGYVALLRHFKIERDRVRAVVREIDLTAFEDRASERDLVAVGAEGFGAGEHGADRYSGLQVATRPDQPWEPQAGVRIRRWDH
jgi:hypothetical protein